MPSSYLYHKDPKTANRITWYILITGFALVLIGVLYSTFFKGMSGYDKDFYENISDIKIPGTSSVIEAYDSGEFWTVTSFKLDKEAMNEFIKLYGFLPFERTYRPSLIGSLILKGPKPEKSQEHHCLYLTGSKNKNNWTYIIDTTKQILWAHIQYPDWAGN